MPSVRQHANAPAVPGVVRKAGKVLPDRLYILAPGFPRRLTRVLALQAVASARLLSPKLSGEGAQGIRPYHGDGFFGLRWEHSYMWFQEQGINPFTMTKLAGKTIPMWIDDPTGTEARANPKAEKRITETGRRQILIFRKVGKVGARKTLVQRDSSGRIVGRRNVPQSYPGAPGRIARRSYDGFKDVQSGHTGRIARLIPRAHVGVRWRHPGIVGREWMQYSLQQVGELARIEDLTVYATYRRR